MLIKFMDVSSVPLKIINYKNMKKVRYINLTILVVLSSLFIVGCKTTDTDLPQDSQPCIKLGAYYFGGWSGKCPYDDGSPGNAWAKDMPSRFTKLLATDFAGREPVWGWREDKQEIMERQIDLAADNGISYFSFVWTLDDGEKSAYAKDGSINVAAIKDLSVDRPIYMFMDANNNDRMEFCLLVAVKSTGNRWNQTVDYWIDTYFGHPRYMKENGNPVVFFFYPEFEKEQMDYLQQAAKAAGYPGVFTAGCRNASAANGFRARTLYNTIPSKGLNNEEIYPFKVLSDWNISVWNNTNLSNTGMPYIPCLTGGWDRRPWEPSDGTGRLGGVTLSPHFARGTPAEFEGYTRSLVSWMDNHPELITKDRLAVVYAWNEIGEGGWIVPCKDDPDGEYLKAIRRVVFGK
jgi:hypothetical protein